MNLKPFETLNPMERSVFKNIPIGHLEVVRKLLKSKGYRPVMRFRGCRTQAGDLRSRTARMQDCQKQFADRFAVYLKGVKGIR